LRQRKHRARRVRLGRRRERLGRRSKRGWGTKRH